MDREKKCLSLAPIVMAACVTLLVANSVISQRIAKQSSSPSDVVRGFVDLDLRGTRLILAGWRRTAPLFVRSGPPPTNPNIHIVSDKYAMVERTLSPTKSRVDLDFTHLYGSLDPELHFVPPAAFGPDGGLVKDGLSISLTLVLVDRYLELESGGGSPKETVTAPTWRIEAFQAGVLLDLPAAIRYVTEKREQTTDPAIKKNADATLAILRLLK